MGQGDQVGGMGFSDNIGSRICGGDSIIDEWHTVIV